jgi:hypothetical protein
VPELFGVNFTENEAVLPAAMVTGKDTPLTVNSELVVVAPETTMLEPDALSVAGMTLLDPTATLPKLALGGETVKVPAVGLFPDRGIVRVLAFESTVRLPVATPLVVGAKDMVKVMLCEGAKVKGGVIPVRPKAVPLVLADEMVTGAVPALVSVSRMLPVAPAFTVPKFTLERLGETLPATPLPLSAKSRGRFVALLVKAIVPVIRCNALGTN